MANTMPASVLPTTLAIPAVALSITSTLRVLRTIGPLSKSSFYYIIDATGIFIVVLGLIRCTAKVLAGTGQLVRPHVNTVADNDNNDADGIWEEDFIDYRSKYGNEGFYISLNDTEDTLEVVRTGEHDFEEFPDSDQERRGRKVKEKSKVKTLSAQEKRWRRIAMLNKKNETV